MAGMTMRGMKVKQPSVLHSPQHPIASRLAPTVGPECFRNRVNTPPCRSEPARDGAGTFNIIAAGQHLAPCAPPQRTVTCNRALLLIRHLARIRNRTSIEKTRKPRNTGLSALSGGYLFHIVKTWHAPCNSPISDSVHYPVSGTLVQAGRGFPSLHRAHTAQATSPNSFGALDTGRSGVPSLHRAHDATREPIPFWSPWYRQAGDSSFIAPGDGSPTASDRPPRCRPNRPSAAGPPPVSATIPCHSNVPASSRPYR